MNTRQSSMLQSLREVQQFLDAHAAKLAGIGETGTRANLNAVVDELTAAAAVQFSSNVAAQSATQTQRVRTHALLREYVRPIVSMAAANLPPLPEITPLGMPSARETGERLVAAARGMATEVAKYEATFVRAGMPKDFLAQFHDAIEGVASAITERRQRQADRGGATQVMEKRLSQARKVLKTLDVLVKKLAHDDAGLLGAWRLLKRQRSRNAAAKLPAPAGNPPFDPIGGDA